MSDPYQQQSERSDPDSHQTERSAMDLYQNVMLDPVPQRSEKLDSHQPFLEWNRSDVHYKLNLYLHYSSEK
jgi:hypothetical protein